MPVGRVEPGRVRDKRMRSMASTRHPRWCGFVAVLVLLGDAHDALARRRPTCVTIRTDETVPSAARRLTGNPRNTQASWFQNPEPNDRPTRPEGPLPSPIRRLARLHRRRASAARRVRADRGGRAGTSAAGRSRTQPACRARRHQAARAAAIDCMGTGRGHMVRAGAVHRRRLLDGRRAVHTAQAGTPRDAVLRRPVRPGVRATADSGAPREPSHPVARPLQAGSLEAGRPSRADRRPAVSEPDGSPAQRVVRRRAGAGGTSGSIVRQPRTVCTRALGRRPVPAHSRHVIGADG